MISHTKPSVLLVVSAPSGAGKTTLCERLLREDPGIRYSVSCTTRKPRVGEVDGEDYHFITKEEFLRRIEDNQFLEYAEVHGSYYGTLKKHVEALMNQGLDVLMDIDVQGADLIREKVGSLQANSKKEIRYADVFILPPSMEVLETRIRGRGTDGDEVIQTRMRNAEKETHRWDSYDYLIVNEIIDESYAALHAVLVAERHRLPS